MCACVVCVRYAKCGLLKTYFSVEAMTGKETIPQKTNVSAMDF